MVALSNPAMEQFFIKTSKPNTTSLIIPDIPLIDLSKPESKHQLVKACQDFGFFKVVNHGVPSNFINKLESKALKFFSSPLSVKEKSRPPDPFGYGNKSIGRNGDVGWVENLLLNTKPESDYPDNFHYSVFVAGVLLQNVTPVKKMACEIMELLADEMKLQPRNVFSKLLMDEQSEILLRDGSWMSVPPDSQSFFINVGDSLQVMTNGRFKSVKHRVVANGSKSRVSMIYFGGPPLNEKIAPLPSLIQGEEDRLYKEFTWGEYKKSTYKSRLSDNRLALFEKHHM